MQCESLGKKSLKTAKMVLFRVQQYLLLLFLLPPTAVPSSAKNTHSNQRKPNHLRYLSRQQKSALARQLLLVDGLQVESEGYFDIVEQPEQFVEIDTQIVSKIYILTTPYYGTSSYMKALYRTYCIPRHSNIFRHQKLKAKKAPLNLLI